MATIRVDNDLKKTADKMFDNIGMTTAIAVQMFLKKFVNTGKFPFEMEVNYIPNDETLKTFEETSLMLKSGNLGQMYKSGDDMITDILQEGEQSA